MSIYAVLCGYTDAENMAFFMKMCIRDREYVARVKELGMNSAAITDHGVMYGVIDFYRAARAEGINPILGCEVYVAPGSRFDREAGSGEDRYYHLVLLAENNQGYACLLYTSRCV